jgi:hypothetical protein
MGDNSIFFKVAEGNFAPRGKESSYENKENISIEKGNTVHDSKSCRVTIIKEGY